MSDFGLSKENRAWLAFVVSLQTYPLLRAGLACCRLQKAHEDRVVVKVEDPLAHRLLQNQESRELLNMLATRAYGRTMTVSVVCEPPSDEELAARHRAAGTLQ